jgi:hypothetical protein
MNAQWLLLILMATNKRSNSNTDLIPLFAQAATLHLFTSL